MKPNPKSEIPNQKSLGFTLVELMVVIVIIGILVGLTLVAVIPARNKARNAVVSLEINQLDIALKTYKLKFAEYPPDFADIGTTAGQNRVMRHLRKAFPRYTPGVFAGTNGGTWVELEHDVSNCCDGLDINDQTPATALAFWLGGPPTTTGSTKLRGFSANPSNPFDNTTDSSLPTMFEFDDTRLSVEDASGALKWPEYYPQVSAGSDTAPYVYFRAWGKEYGVKISDTEFVPLSYTYATDNICVPYLISSDGLPTLPGTVRRWNNLKTFQIISAGLDGQFGDSAAETFRFSKSGTGFSPNGGDFDNLTNFTHGKLEDEME